MDILSLMLDYHPAGWFVLCGREPWPDDEEVAEMLAVRRGGSEPVRVSGGKCLPEAQRRVEAIEGARQYLRIMDAFGGPAALTATVRIYERENPRDCAALRLAGSAGVSGQSAEEIAYRLGVDVKTLRRRRHKALLVIAMRAVYGGK